MRQTGEVSSDRCVILFAKHNPISNHRIDIANILIYLLIIPVIRPSGPALEAFFGINAGDFVSRFLGVWNMVSIVVSIFLMFVTRTSPSAMFGIVVGICTCLCISDVFNNTFSVSRLLLICGNILAVFAAAEVYAKDKIVTFMKAWYHVLTFYMILNSLTMYIYYPHGMYTGGLLDNNTNYYLFALDNVCFLYVIAGLIIGDLLCELKVCRRIYFNINYIFIMLAYIYVQAGTALAIIFLYIFMKIMLAESRKTVFRYDFCLLFMVISFVFIVVLNTVGVLTPLLNLINKDVTFSGRTDIWAAAFRGLGHGHILFGYGTDPSVIPDVLTSYGPSWLIGIGHLHNVCMQFLFNGGIICLLVFVLLWIIPFSKMMNKNYKKISSLLNIYIVLYWLTFMFEFRLQTYTFWLLPIMLNNVDKLCMVERCE